MTSEGHKSGEGDAATGSPSHDDNDISSSQSNLEIMESKILSGQEDSSDIDESTGGRRTDAEEHLNSAKWENCRTEMSEQEKLDGINETRALINTPGHLPHLPNEIWLTILASIAPHEGSNRCSCDYFDLKNCSMVNKTFESLTKSSCFDASLFRTHVLPEDKDIDVKSLRLHPAFDRITHYDIDDACLYQYSKKGHQKFLLKDTSAAKEFATCPAVRLIRIGIKTFPKFDVRNRHGLTVLQVWRAVCRFLEKTNTRSITRGEIWYEDDETLATWGEALGDLSGWTGWNGKFVDSKGRLNLDAWCFDP